MIRLVAWFCRPPALETIDVTIEIETKMAISDPQALRQRLTELGANRGRLTLETNLFFDTPDSSLRASDQGLRLRIEQPVKGGSEKIILTHKGPRAHGRLKSRSETELGVSSAAQAIDLLRALGYSQVFSFQKRRESWELDGCQIALDQVPHLGRFVEIEGPSDQAVLTLRSRLGLETAALLSGSYVSMLIAYANEHHLPSRQIIFDSPGDAKE